MYTCVPQHVHTLFERPFFRKTYFIKSIFLTAAFCTYEAPPRSLKQDELLPQKMKSQISRAALKNHLPPLCPILNRFIPPLSWHHHHHPFYHSPFPIHPSFHPSFLPSFLTDFNSLQSFRNKFIDCNFVQPHSVISTQHLKVSKLF